MKIAFVLPDFRGGGAEKVFITLANHLSLTNDVFFIVGSNSGSNKDFVSKNIKVIETGVSGIKAIFKIKKTICQNNISVSIGTLNMAHALAVMKLFCGRDVKVFSRLGNTISHDLKNQKGVKFYLQYLYQYLLCLSDGIIVQSKAMENDLYDVVKLPIIKNKTKLIYNPVDKEAIYDFSCIEPSFKVYKEDIVSIGRLEKQKDFPTTLKAFKKYLTIYPYAKLHILGDGSLKNELNKLAVDLAIDKSVYFHGHVLNPYAILKSSKFLVMSSLYEGFSNVILESICLKVPVVVSDCPGGNSEIVKNHVNGFLFEVSNYEDLCDKMLLASEFNFTIPDIDEYDIDNIAAQYKDVISV